MSIEAVRTYPAYKPVVYFSKTRYTAKSNLRGSYIGNALGKSIAAKIAFEASLEKSMLSRKYWDELLEKLRKSGGGGSGSSSKFDRIAVSMMLSSFLSTKTIQAMLRNFGGELSSLKNGSEQINNANQSTFIHNIQSFGKTILNNITNILSLIIRKEALPGRLYSALQKTSSFIGILSFQLNKLKQILEEDLKEAIKKLDIKEKIKKIKKEFSNVIDSLMLRISKLIGFKRDFL